MREEPQQAGDGSVVVERGRVRYTVRPVPAAPSAEAGERVLRALARGVADRLSQRPWDADLDRAPGVTPEADGTREGHL